MCGIAGLIRFDGQQVDPNILARMAKIQSHRGPDDEGLWVEDNVGFAFRRLAILDLSSAGHQPMFSPDGKLVVVFNGEIYNHSDLRQELQQHGYNFRSSSDTEVILAAYAQWGLECLNRFNGMWAFALWDIVQNRLFCARDRFGIKPFYYHKNGNRFIFASEIKALLTDIETPRQPNEISIYTYLVFGQVHFDEQTFFAQISQLSAGHYLIVDNQNITIERYWHLDPNSYNPHIKDKDAIENFRDLFFDSVRLRLQSDVPIGTCLSGGLDSSAIVCVANQILFGNQKKPDRTIVAGQQKVFSACYSDPIYDERQWIEPVIAKTGAASHYTFPGDQGLLEDIEEMIWHQEEPVAGTSIYAQWCVMRLARQEGAVVMLDGQGGDEVMCGYQRYYWDYIAGLIRSFKAEEFLQAFAQPWGTRTKPGLEDWLKVGRRLLPSSYQLFPSLLYKYVQRNKWLGESLQLWQTRFQGYSDHPSFVGQSLERDLLAESLPALLKYEDRSSMSHSIEARVPFLDYRLVEFMYSLPDHMKIRNGQMKWLLRQALKEILPIEVVNRRSKMGFATPENHWLSQNWLYIQHKFFPEKAIERDWLKREAITELLKTPTSLKSLDFHLVWRWINIEIWLRQMIDNKSSKFTD